MGSFLLWLLACGAPPVDAQGPHPVTSFPVQVTDASRDRTLDLQVYAPTRSEPRDTSLWALVPERADELEALVLGAPAGCATTSVEVALEEPIRGDDLPLVAISHCHECLGVSGASVAVRLASHGFLAVTVDHRDNLLWNKLDDDGAPLGTAFLDTREADLAFVLDRALAGDLGTTVDPGRVGVLGHSYGGATVGRVLQDDPRVGAGMALAAPFANPLMPGVDPEAIDAPAALLVAVEDNSITEVGNQLMRRDFEAVSGPAYKLELDDAGHWSVSDLAGVHPDLMPGCGDGLRQTNGEPFTYLSPPEGRDAAMIFATAFFRAALDGDTTADAWLTENVERR